MTTDYEVEEQGLLTENTTTEQAESVETEVSQLKKEAKEEELFFWSEPGVCG